GWDTEIPATMPAGDMTITAKWTVNQYTITFADTGDTAIPAITQNYGTAITKPANPTKTGYTFDGWDTEIPATMPAGDMTITAKWTINQYTITFNTDGGTEVAPITQDYNTAVSAPTAPTKTGYTFAGWSPEVPATMPAENVTVTAQWTINQYSITFDTDGGSAINPITQDYGTDVTAPENPTKEGYTFDGWDKEIPATMPAENVTITAKWKINQYTITFANTGDAVIDPITQDYGTVVTAPENPTKIGYTFDGWDTEIPATMPAGDMTITAKWKINQYTITFDTDGGTEVAPITQDYATAVTAPENPTKTGYTFLCWSEEVPATMPAENKTLTAQWQINQYTVTFLDAEGGVFSESTLDYGTVIVAPADAPAKQYYTFSGWSLDGTTVSADLGTVPANNVEITPIFERVPVELKPADGSKAIITVDDDASDPKTGFVYGLDTRLTQSKLLSDYLAVEGDGRIEVTLTKFKVCGTGTRIDVIDNVTDKVVAKYYIVIFGDINGDGDVGSLDTKMLNSEVAGKTSWHINDKPQDADAAAEELYYQNKCKVLAADLDNGGTDGGHDGLINQDDLTLLYAVTLEIAEIDQQTGKVTYY
ncbi:MAG: InlB B-repeat-containing protein, partial [Acutalibacteraceae bacterium]